MIEACGEHTVDIVRQRMRGRDSFLDPFAKGGSFCYNPHCFNQWCIHFAFTASIPARSGLAALERAVSN